MILTILFGIQKYELRFTNKIKYLFNNALDDIILTINNFDRFVGKNSDWLLPIHLSTPFYFFYLHYILQSTRNSAVLDMNYTIQTSMLQLILGNTSNRHLVLSG